MVRGESASHVVDASDGAVIQDSSFLAVQQSHATLLDQGAVFLQRT